MNRVLFITAFFLIQVLYLSDDGVLSLASDVIDLTTKTSESAYVVEKKSIPVSQKNEVCKNKKSEKEINLSRFKGTRGKRLSHEYRRVSHKI